VTMLKRVPVLFSVVASSLWLKVAMSAEKLGGEGDPANYKYHSQSVLAIGKTFAPNDITEPKFPCIEGEALSLDAGPPRTALTLSYARGFEDFASSTNSEVKGEANIKLITAKKDLHAKHSYLSSSDTMTVIVTASTDFGRWGLSPKAKLAAAAKAVLIDGKAFYDLCGSRYVAIERRGASASAAIIVSNVSNEVKDSITQDLIITAKAPTMGAKATAIFNQEIKRASKQDRLKIEVTGTGGVGLGNLEAIVRGIGPQDNPLQAIGDGLSKFLQGFSKDNAAPYEYTVASLDHFGWSPQSIPKWTDYQELKLRQIADAIRRYIAELDGWDSYLNRGVVYKMFGETIRDAAETEVKQLRHALDIWSKSYVKCQQAKGPADCELPEVYAGGRDFSIPPSPRLYFYVAAISDVSTKMLGEDLSRVVLSAADAFGPLYKTKQLAQVRNFHDGANGFNAFVGISGSYLKYASIVFVESDGKVHRITNFEPIDESGGTLFIWSNSRDIVGLENTLGLWMRSYSGAHEGTFYVDIKDALDRSFRVAFVDARWDAVHYDKFTYVDNNEMRIGDYFTSLKLIFY